MYSDILVLSPEGEELHRCSEEKAEWYINKGLAIEDPYGIRLTKNLSFDGSNPFYVQKRKNICVVCGTDKRLTRHHIIPQCYLKFCTKHYSTTNSSHDIVLLCHKHHDAYEIKAMSLKNKIFREMGIEYEKIGKVTKYAKTLYSGRPFRNQWEKENLTRTVNEYLGRDYTHEDLKNIIKQPCIYEKAVLSISLDKLPDFFQRWRQHFIKETKPKYMPDHWTVEGKWV